MLLFQCIHFPSHRSARLLSGKRAPLTDAQAREHHAEPAGELLQNILHRIITNATDGELKLLSYSFKIRARLFAEEYLVHTSGEDTNFNFSCCYGLRLSKKPPTHIFKSSCLCRADLRTTEFLLSGHILLHRYTEATLWHLSHSLWAGSCWHLSEAQQGLPCLAQQH